MAVKKKNRRAVLVTSCVLAALIVAGSTFAWFSSKDEVTNRLSASANYGVTIAEDFTPPENWIPGQEVDKNVAFVNTGNVDAFVRAWLEGEMKIVNEAEGTAYTSIPDALTNTDDPKLIALGLTKYTGTGNNKVYYKTLSKTETANPNDNNVGTNNDTANNDTTYSEVKAVQAGGWLAYAGGTFTFEVNQPSTYIDTTGAEREYAAGATVTSTQLQDTWTQGVGLAIDSDSFRPTEPGLFIFRRNIDIDSNSNADYEYSGYYFDGTDYYALKCATGNRSDYTLPDNALTITYATANDATSEVAFVEPNANLKLLTASETTLQTDQMRWFVDEANNVISIQYSPDDTWASEDAANFGNDIVIDIQLVNVTRYNTPGNAGNTPSEQWSAFTSTVGSSKYATFYYNNDLEDGDTTARLVESVTLNSKVTQNAFYAFDFDLNVFMDSIQVANDATGNETFSTVSGGWTTTDSHVTEAKAEAVAGTPEINNIIWTAN